MNIYSKLRRNIINEGEVYKIKNLFGSLIKENKNQATLLDDPEFYDISTKTLKLGSLCSKDIKLDTTPKINMGGQIYTTYCALSQLSKILEPSLVPKLHYNIDKIYSFLRRDLKYDNKRKFHSLMKTILEYDDPANTMNIIVNFIEGENNVDEIGVALDRFRKSKEVSELEIDEFLRRVKSAGHQEYEKSFYGEHFQKYQTRLSLKYKTETENLTILTRIEDVIDGKYTVEGAVNSLYKNINENYSAQEMIKADLKCIKSVYDKNGDIIIENGELIEVKKIDYAADSYLSEFMSMYKNSLLPDYAHEPEYLKTYNQIIDGLYQKFESRGDILEDVKNNFAGIIYDDKIFIDKKDVELYWSNKGRSNCLKDHRLSIRYRIKSSNLIGYVYEGGDALTEKPINIKIPTNKQICSKTTPRKVKESYNLQQISNLLLEGRKEDILKKYGGENQEVIDTINYFSVEDPSGNNKYLEWMFKNWAGLGKDRNYSPLDYEVVDLVKLFHQNVQRVKNKDINSYSFKELEETVEEAEEKRRLTQLKKEAKKQKTVIYEDDNWFVVSPHSWKASCYYGAGTKWCVTSKDTSGHWDNYSKRATFFYIIDKNKTKKDRYYKVAYRQLKKEGKFELWDAEDLEFSSRRIGREWFNELPEELKNKALIYHKEKFPKVENLPEWIEYDYGAQALVNHLDTADISKTNRDHYGLNVYEVDGEDWCSAEDSEMEDAMYEVFYDYDEEELIEYYDEDGYYIELNDKEDFIDNEVDSYVSDLSDEEILERTGLDTQIADLEVDLENLRDELNDVDGDDDEKIEDLESEIEEISDNIESLRDTAREDFTEEYRDDWENCLNDGVVYCLVYDKGWFSSAVDLYKSGLVYLEKDDLVDSLIGNGDWDRLCPNGYEEEQDDDGDFFNVFQID